MKKVEITKHQLVPKHQKLSEKEKSALLEKHNISLEELPKISKKDPAIAHLEVKVGDVIKIIRPSKTAGETEFYRGVANV